MKTMKTLALTLWVLAAPGMAGLAADNTDPVFHLDFENGPDLHQYPELSFQGVEAAIVEPGAGGSGHALRLHSLKPGRYAQVTIQRPFPAQKNLVLSFDHREEVEAGGQAAYLGVLFNDGAGKQWFGENKFGPEWKHAEIVLAELHSPNHGVLELGKMLERVAIYGRAKGDSKAVMTVWLDNVTLRVQSRESRLGDEVRTSTSNPPFFNWPRAQGPSKLQFSTDPGFPDAKTTTLTVDENFYTPPQPIEPGLWYWRVWRSSALSEGWSETRRVNIVPEAHRFVTPPVPVAKIAAMPRPRVIDLDAARKEHAGKDTAALVKAAEKLHRGGVPADPPRYAPGNPDWPTWIDWYGKVAGGITGKTGLRLQRIAPIAALTRDPQVLAWTKEMAMAAAAWDPKGGSAMEAGDIGAQHLLRGLSDCYDLLHDDLTADERQELRAVIIARALQFRDRLNPFHGTEENNHAWLQTLALAEAGFVLIGEHDEAAAWTEFARQLYLGRFLCCLGYQGDNNEGIGYWDYGLGFVIEYGDLMRHVCGVNLFEHPWLSQTARFPMYCAPPGAWAVSFADTAKPNHSVQGPAEQKHVRELALRTHDPYALWYAGATNAVDGIAPKPPADLPQSIHYRYIGWVIFNTSLVDGLENSTFAMRSGRFYAGHQHDDQNGFVIHAYGEKLAIDSGYYDWWGSPHFLGYSTTTRAHNAILVNGKCQAHMQKGADGRIAAYYDSPAYGYTVGDASNPAVYPGQLSRFDRRVLFIKPGFVVIHDLLQSADAPARYDWLLHTVAPIETDATGRSFALTFTRAALRGRFLAPAKLAMAVTKGYPVEPADGYSTRPVPPEKYSHEWTLTTTPAQPAVNEDFVTAMQVQRLAPPAEPEARIESLAATGAFGVRIIAGNDTHLILFRQRNARGTMSGGDLETDGTAAAVRFDSHSGAVQSAFAAGATRLSFRGRELFHSATPVDWSLPAERKQP
jgi:Domain of unknown function (DUF4962)/Heparinase II/III-like protein